MRSHRRGLNWATRSEARSATFGTHSEEATMRRRAFRAALRQPSRRSCALQDATGLRTPLAMMSRSLAA